MTRAGITLDNISFGKKPENESSVIQSPQGSDPHTPFHALVLADFSGNASESKTKKPRQIDRDNFEEVLASISPHLTLSLGDTGSHPISIHIRELEDFEPDALFDSLDIFSDLRSLRRRLSNNSTFEAAAKEMGALQDLAAPTPSAKRASPNQVNDDLSFDSASGDVSLLDSVLAESDTRIEQQKENLAATLIQDIIAPYIVPSEHPEKSALIDSVDQSTEALMKTILHHKSFQALESTWRSLYLCIREIETDAKTKLFIYDIKKQELLDDCQKQTVESSRLFKTGIEPYTSIAGGIPWSVIVGDYSFSTKQDDIQLLNVMGQIAQHCNATFIAGSESEVVGCDDIASQQTVDDWTNETAASNAGWTALRNTPQSSHIALSFPRVLLRIPYGEKTSPIEAFQFEENASGEHESYLWGNAAYRILILLADSYQNSKWNFVAGENNEIDDLPAHYYVVDGETELKPCAEIYLNERGAERIISNGLLATWSILRKNAVRVGPFSSLHSSNQRIRGRWQN